MTATKGTGETWTATATVLSTTPAGPVAFAINFQTAAGAMAAPTTATTDGSAVTVDRVTLPPTTSMVPGSFSGPLAIPFNLPEAPLAGSVQILFRSSSDGTLVSTLTLAATQEVAGNRTLTFNPGNPTASADVASGAALPDGTYSLAISYQDEEGNPAATVWVYYVRIDNVPPVITSATMTPAWAAPGSTVWVVVTANESLKLVSGAIAGQTATSSIYPTASARVSLPSNIPEGPLSFSVTVTDLAGNVSAAVTSTQDGIYTQVDRIKPTLTVPGPITAEATSQYGAVVPFQATATDDLDPAPRVTSNVGNDPFFHLGTTTVQVTATDHAGNSSTGSFTVTVRDTSPPVFMVPPNITAEATGPNGAPVTFDVQAIDAVDGARPVTISAASGSTFPFGTTTISATAADTRGNTGNAAFTITVRDTTPPAASVPATLSVEAGPKGAALGDLRSYVTRSDAVGVVSVVQSPDAHTVKPPGSYLVSFTLKDAANNQTTVQTMVQVEFDRVTDPTVKSSAQAGPGGTGAPAPGAGTAGGPPEGTTLGAFFTPAISDYRHMAARATLLAGRKRLAAIYVEDGAGLGTLAAFQSKQADGLDPGVTFESFLDPLLAPGGAIAFEAKVSGPKPTEDEAVWTDAFGALAPVLREGHDVPGLPPGVTLKSVTSLSLRDGELLALVKLNKAAGLVTAKDDQALVLLTGPTTGTKQLRTGDKTNGVATVLAITAFAPAQFSLGQGSTHADAGVVARVKTDTDGDEFVRIDDDGTPHVLLSTTAEDATLGAQAVKMSLPATAGTALAARISARPAGTTKALDSVIFSSTGARFSEMQSAGDAAGGGATFAAFADPVVNDTPRAVFMAKIEGDGIKAPGNMALFEWNDAYELGEIVRTGTAATGGDGTELPDTTWRSLSNYALPDGPSAGVVFTAEVTGKAVTAKNEVGLWAEDSTRLIRLLLRGDQDVTLAPGVTKKLANFKLLDALPGSFGSRRSYNSAGSVAVLATFADKTQVLLRVDIP